MKKIILITILLTGCSSYVTKPEAAKAYDEIAKTINQNAAYTQLLVKKTYEKEIAQCKKQDLGLNLATLECVKEPTK